MKFLCTGDLHLKEKEPCRLNVLRWLCKQTIRQQVDGMFIVGDLFDSSSDFRALKTTVKDLLSESLDNVPVVIIPGNHDEELSSELFLGEKVKVLDEDDYLYQFNTKEIKVNIVGIPYHKGKFGSFYIDQAKFSGTDAALNIVLSHASLIDSSRGYIQRKIEEQNDKNSFVFFTEDFSDRNIDALILGHWHGSDNFREYSTYFLYPGSPIPNSKRETGRKSYVIIKILDGGEIEFEKQYIESPDSWYYERRDLFVTPGNEEDSSEEFNQGLLKTKPEGTNCHLIVNVRGFIAKQSEMKLRQALDKVKNKHSEKFSEIEFDWQVQPAKSLNNPLVSRFTDEVNNLDISEISLDEILTYRESAIRSRFESAIENYPKRIKRRILETTLRVFADRL